MGDLMPLIDVFGFGLGLPALWPMGIGAGEPSALVPESKGRWFEFTWAAGQLARVDKRNSTKGLVRRTTYQWTGNQLDREDRDETSEDGLDGPDGTPDYSDVWAWKGGRPVRRQTVSRRGTIDATADWTWAADGRSVEIFEHSEAGSIARHAVHFAQGGQLESVVTVDGKSGEMLGRLEVLWHGDGRIASARRLLPELAAPLDITFTWAEDGRLAEQTSNIHGTPRRWFYRYGGEEAT